MSRKSLELIAVYYSVLLFLILWGCCCAPIDPQNELLSVIVVIVALNLSATYPTKQIDSDINCFEFYRHGDRTPSRTYPNSPHKNSSLWPVGPRQLLNQGKMRQFELGKWLRNRYSKFLPEKYSERDIWIRSSDTDRTLASAAATLSGLYPPVEDQVWNPDLAWQPIPVHTVPVGQDQLVRMMTECPKFKKLREDLMKTAYFKKVKEDNQALFEYLSEHSGTEIKSIDDVEVLHRQLFIETTLNFTLPEWTKSVYPNKVKSLAVLSLSTYTFNEELARLAVGVFLDHVITHFTYVIEHPEKSYKLVMFSGHESGLADILGGLGIFDNDYPFYTSTFIFELRKINRDHHVVNMFYKRLDDLKDITIKKCKFNCEFKKFQRLLKNVAVNLEQWKKECFS